MSVNFKQAIDTLIGVTSAKPKKGVYQKISVIGDGTNRSFTMPVDGWVSLTGQGSTGSNITSCFLWGNEGEEAPTASGTIEAKPGYTFQGLGFFRKGQAVFYNIVGFSLCEARIFSIIGGGA